MKKRIAFLIGAGFLVLVSGVLLWRLIVERQRTKHMITLVEEESSRSADFVVYRAYKDASSEIKSGILYFSSRDGWERSFQIGSLKVVVELVSQPFEESQSMQLTPIKATLAARPSTQQSNAIDWHSVYNWNKSRAAYRRLQQSPTTSDASELLNGLEQARILTHPERLGIESTNVVDPY